MKTALVLHSSTSTIFVTEHSGNATGYDYYYCVPISIAEGLLLQ